MKQKLGPILLASLSLGLLFDLLFFDKIPGISVLILTIFILVLTYCLATLFRKNIPTAAFAVAPVALFFAAMVFIRADGFLVFINVVIAFCLLSLIAQIIRYPGKRFRDYAASAYIARVFAFPFESIGAFLDTTQKMFDLRSELSMPKSKAAPWLRGIVIAIPFLTVFVILFASADLVFQHAVNSIFSFDIPDTLIPQTLLAGFITACFIGAFAVLFLKQSRDEAGVRRPAPHIGNTESFIVLGLVAALFLGFVLIQLAYLFGGTDTLKASGFTYSEYARKGFFELIIVAVITLAMIMVFNNTTRREVMREKVIHMWLNGILIAEVMLIMLSAHKRLSLYEQAYGFTSLRLFSHLFIGWLAVVFILLFIYIYREQERSRFALQFFASLIAFFALYNLFNPGALIAKQNIQRYRETGKIDLNYLGSLSSDAVPQLASLLDDPNEKVRHGAANQLYKQMMRQRDMNSGWQSYNISRSKAENIYAEKADKLQGAQFYNDYHDLDK